MIFVLINSLPNSFSGCLGLVEGEIVQIKEAVDYTEEFKAILGKAGVNKVACFQGLEEGKGKSMLWGRI